ncbi:DUF1707 SHOCT-like domain-containing protein [Nonomuraea muscovyensis]|uniref:DUF1707 domain-containing protein n=1 Tax=Nonomuraea muscovyensis TaxID=1124761 RepID=A0A7X0F1W2_9ACTN|nr:DUF1707 domain-containing protein [Nonomuraea muscovyensis]MBB6350119.1 hypothetical protein [Nonomuraea muscovyensis]
MGESVPPDRMRAGDRDREVAIESLRAAFEEGRLDLAEFDARLSRASTAGTFGELERLVGDLPATPAQGAASRSVPRRAERPPRPRPAGATNVLRGGFAVVFLNFSVWLVLAVNQGFDRVHPWWIWVAAGWGAVLLGARTIRKQRAKRPGIDGTHRRAWDEGRS